MKGVSHEDEMGILSRCGSYSVLLLDGAIASTE
jgi:hypothetical protein